MIIFVLKNKVTLQAIEDTINHKSIQGPYDNVDELMEALHAEDIEEEINQN